MSRIRLMTMIVAVVFATACANSARAAVVYAFEADASNFDVTPGGTKDISIFIRETGSPSQIAADNGLFSAGVKVLRATVPSSPASLTAITANGSFDGTVNKTIAAADSSLYEDHNSGTGPGALPDGTSRILLGTFTVTAGSIEGQVTSFNIVDYNAVSDDTVTYAFSALDSQIQPGTFTVTAAVPEPTSIGIVAAIGALLLGQRRRR